MLAIISLSHRQTVVIPKVRVRKKSSGSQGYLRQITDLELIV